MNVFPLFAEVTEETDDIFMGTPDLERSNLRSKVWKECLSLFVGGGKYLFRVVVAVAT